MSLYVNIGGLRRITALYAGTADGNRPVKKLVSAHGAVFSQGGRSRSVTVLGSSVSRGSHTGSNFTSYSSVRYADGVLTGVDPYTDGGPSQISGHSGRFAFFPEAGSGRVCFIDSVSAGTCGYTAVDTAGFPDAAYGEWEDCGDPLAAGTYEFISRSGPLGPLYGIRQYG